MSLHRLQTNAFWVLELPVDASRARIERAAARLIDELALERSSAARVDTPLGELERTPERRDEPNAPSSADSNHGTDNGA